MKMMITMLMYVFAQPQKPLRRIVLILQLLLLIPDNVFCFQQSSLQQQQHQQQVRFREGRIQQQRTKTWNKSVFVAVGKIRKRKIRHATASAATILPEPQSTNPKKRVCVVILPAQFCVAQDYQVLIDNLHTICSTQTSNNSTSSTNNNIEIGSCVVCDLPRTEWIKVAKQVPTMEFWNSNLNVQKTLDWYFRSIDQAIFKVLQMEASTSTSPSSPNNNVNICLIGHSIGGWIGRAYLGGMGCTKTSIERNVVSPTMKRTYTVTSYISLGTPHIVSKTSLVDQTRGLIANIERTPTCQPSYLRTHNNISITCVCSDSITTLSSGKKRNAITSNTVPIIEQLIALTSYLPLIGFNALLFNRTNMVGDGIVPLEVAFMKDSPYFVSNDNDLQQQNNVIVSSCMKTNQLIRHSHVVPTPWNLIQPNEPSISLPYPSYVSDGVVQQWYKYIQ